MKLLPLPVTFHLTYIDEDHFAPLRARIEARFRELLEKNCGLGASTLLFHTRRSPKVEVGPSLKGALPSHISYPQIEHAVLRTREAFREPAGVDVVFTRHKLCFFPEYPPDYNPKLDGNPRDLPQRLENGDLHDAASPGVFLDPLPGCSSLEERFAMSPGAFFLAGLNMPIEEDRDRAADAYAAIAGHEVFHILLSRTLHDENRDGDARKDRCLFAHVQGDTPQEVIAWADAMMARIDTVICGDCCRGALSEELFQRVTEYRDGMKYIESKAGGHDDGSSSVRAGFKKANGG